MREIMIPFDAFVIQNEAITIKTECSCQEIHFCMAFITETVNQQYNKLQINSKLSMSKEINNMLTQQAQQLNLPINFLREKIYPELYQALISLIDHIIKTDEVRKHQERLKRKKVFDKLEQKRVEKEKLKADLGSEYISSDDDSIDFDDIGLEKEELEKILQERKKKDDPELGEEGKEDADDSDLIEKQKGQSEELTPNSSGPKLLEDKSKAKNLVLIEENEEKEDENEKDIQAEKEKLKNELKQQREDLAFNPLKFLAEKLLQIHQSKK